MSIARTIRLIVKSFLILLLLFPLLSGGFIVLMEFLGVPPSAYMTTGDH